MSSHFDESGHPRMVDISAKRSSARVAVAETTVRLRPETVALIRGSGVAKGDVIAVARLAAIAATKHTSLLIPLCHSIPVEAVDVECEFPSDDSILITVSVKTSAKTGVEMEALAAASVAGLTIYDMCKSVDREIEIGPTRLRHKSGGESGLYERDHFPRGSGG